MTKNMEVLNSTLNSLRPGDIFLVPNQTFHLLGGIRAVGVMNVTIQIDGTLSFSDDRETWPVDASGGVLPCLRFDDIENVVFTSSGKGTLNGNGQKWWGAIKFLKNQVSQFDYFLYFNI